MILFLSSRTFEAKNKIQTMSKKRKTKKEKMRAGERHDFSTVFTFNPQDNSQKIKVEIQDEKVQAPPSPIHSPRNSKSYAYVTRDVKIPLLVTTALLAVNVLFFLILKSKIISLSGIIF